MVLASAGPAFGHGFGGRVDLPVPRWMFVFGASAALVISFVALSVLWREPRLQEARSGRALPRIFQAVLNNRTVGLVVRALSFILFLVLIAGAFGGSQNENIAPVLVYVWGWVGLAFAHAIFGNLWATLSPWDTFARMLGLRAVTSRPYPKAWGKWPATLLLTGFLWMELVDPNGATPGTIGIAIGVYTLIILAGMSLFGRQVWNENGEAFAVYFGLFARIAPFSRDAEGRVVLRPLLGGLPLLAPRPGLVAFVMVMLGSTTFDGVTRTSAWSTQVGELAGPQRVMADTVGLLLTILAVALAYALAMRAAAAITGQGWHPLSVKFVHSLVPIAFAYVVAHYFSLLVLEGQWGLALLSDPFGAGWNVFGTVDWEINYSLVSPITIWYVQVAAIVGGHVAGVVLGHDRAIALFPHRQAVRTQYALLAVMVVFTAVGLLILSGG